MSKMTRILYDLCFLCCFQGDEEGDFEDKEGPQEDDAQDDACYHPRVKFPFGNKIGWEGWVTQSFWESRLV